MSEFSMFGRGLSQLVGDHVSSDNDVLTPEKLQKVMNDIYNLQHDSFRYPRSCVGGMSASDKYVMGGKRGIEKWQLKPLVEQYTAKLKALC